MPDGTPTSSILHRRRRGKACHACGGTTRHAAAAVESEDSRSGAGTGCAIVSPQAARCRIDRRWISAARRRTRDSVSTSIMRLLLPSVLRAVNRAKLLLGSQVRRRFTPSCRALFAPIAKNFHKSRSRLRKAGRRTLSINYGMKRLMPHSFARRSPIRKGLPLMSCCMSRWYSLFRARIFSLDAQPQPRPSP